MDRLRILDICQGELNVTEIKGRKDNPRIIEYHRATSLKASDDETPWCAAFVNWTLAQAGARGTGSAAARSFLKWGTRLDEPRIGCIVVFKRGKHSWQGHVGFYMGRNSKGDVLCLGGNQRDQVCVESYSSDKVLGYRTGAS